MNWELILKEKISYDKIMTINKKLYRFQYNFWKNKKWVWKRIMSEYSDNFLQKCDLKALILAVCEGIP